MTHKAPRPLPEGTVRPSPPPAPPKGGQNARTAALLCQNEQFRLYLDRRRRAKFNMDIPDGTHTEQDAKEFIINACGIASRAELDHNAAAAKMFYKIQKLFNQSLRRFNQQ